MTRLTTLLTGLALSCGITVASATEFEMRSSRVQIDTKSASSLRLAFDLSEIEQQTTEQAGMTRSSFQVAGEGFTYVKGMPVLPAISRLVVVPGDAGLSLHVEADTPQRFEAEYEPMVCDEEDLPDPDITAMRTGPGGLYPPEIAEMSEPFVIRGVRLVRVTTYPVQYDPATGEFIRHERIDAEIEFTNDAPVNPAFHPVRRNRSKTFLKFMSGLAINPADIGRDDPDYDRDPEYIGHYLVVIPTDLVRYAGEFIEWRRRGGYKVDVLVIPNNDLSNAGRIKSAIQARYDAYVDDGIDPFDNILLVGDHATYDNCGTIGIGTGLASPQGRPIWGNHAHYDWDYGNMEGNDDFADVGVSRFIAGNQQAMDLFVGRTLSYERDPYWDDTGWFNRAFTYSQRWAQNWHVSLNINARWAHAVMEAVGYTEVSMQENIDQAESQGERVGPAIRDAFNRRTAVMAGRAENYFFRSNFVGQGVRANGVYPIDIDVAGHHEWSCWWMLRSMDGNNKVGPVAATTGWGGQQTLPYSVIWMEMVNGLMLRDLPYGWSRLQGLIAPTTYIPNFFNTYYQVTTDVEYYGDPFIQPWVGVPTVVTAEIPESITPTTRRVSLRVLDTDDNPVQGAQVTVYAPGSVPGYNDQGYPGYDDMQMWTKKSDEDGYATFVFDDGTEFVNNTHMYFTVTGRKIKPFLEDVPIGAPDVALDISSWELTDEQGNGDGIPNPGEAFTLQLTAKNVGNREDLQDVSAIVTTDSPWIQLDANEVWFGDLDHGQEVQANAGIQLWVDPSCPDGVTRPVTRPVIDIEFHAGDQVWNSAIIIEPHSPHFEIRNVIGGSVIPTEAVEKDIEITNVGSGEARSSRARLVNAGMGVTVVNAEGRYASLAPGRSGRLQNNERFLLSGTRVVVPGWQNAMLLIIEDDAGFIDTVTFNLQVGQPRENAPQGPDAYGYICFDDTDTDWDMAPDYNWVEIDPRANDAEFDGERIDFEGRSNQSIGEALGVELPFETQFYGILYDRISVATNGFISFGNQDTIVNFQNWPMDRAIGGGVGMLAPFWDQLQLGQNGQVYTYFDEEDNRFIIEWSRLRHQNGGQNDLTFQVILYSHRVWITETGDQNILFQYKTISDVQGIAGWQNEVPYASIGISSPHGDTGLNYSFNNVKPVTSAAITNRRALLFSTSPRFRSGMLYGMVTDIATGQPIENALVFTEHGFIANTNVWGEWRINEALAEVPFTIYCHMQGYNDSVYVDLLVEEDDSLEINFDLLHPEFTISTETISATLEDGQIINIGFNLTNTGNGPLEWNAEKRLLGDANAAPWELRRRYNASQITGDDRIEGVVFAQDKFFLSGANGNEENMIYVLNRDGEQINSFPQVNSSRYGYKDMDWDGSYLWAAGQDSIYCLSTDGQVVTSWEDPGNPSQYLAYNQEDNTVYLSGTTTNIVRCDTEGNVLEGQLNRMGLRIYGLGFWPEDPDGYDLYILNRPAGTESQVTKMNAEGDTITVWSFPQDSSATGSQSVWITNEFDVYSWVMMSIQNVSNDGGGDRIEIHQLDARKDWMDVDVWSGELDTWESQDFALTFNAAGLPDTTFLGEILFTHNSDDGEMILSLELDVGGFPPEQFSLALPEDGDTLVALPLHGDTLHTPDVFFSWFPSHDPNNLDVVSYEVTIQSANESRIITAADTFLVVNLDTLNLPLWFDSQVNWSVAAYSGEESASCVRSFVFSIIPNDVDREKFVRPVEFGLGPVYPNPFNSRTSISFGIDKAAPVSLRLYDLEGRVAANLFEGEATAGFHKLTYEGNALASGVYLLRLESLGRTRIAKVALIK